MSASAEPSRARLAAIGFVGHYPAIWLLYRRRLNPETARLNLVVLGATLLAIPALGLTVGPVAGLAAFVCGHLTWSSLLARRILTGRAFRSS